MTNKTCQCNMFKTAGTCYHTGYRPTFRDEIPETPFTPEAIRRTQQFIKEHGAKFKKEDEAKDGRR